MWVVVRLEEQVPARLNPATRSRMMDELFEAWLKERVKQVLSGGTVPALPPMPAASEDLSDHEFLCRPDSSCVASSPSTCCRNGWGRCSIPCWSRVVPAWADRAHPKVMPKGVLLVRSGQLRSLAPAPRGKGLRTIERLGPGSAIGWVGLVRQQPCEHLRATTEVEALLLPGPALSGAAGGPSLHRGGVPAPAGGC